LGLRQVGRRRGHCREQAGLAWWLEPGAYAEPVAKNGSGGRGHLRLAEAQGLEVGEVRGRRQRRGDPNVDDVSVVKESIARSGNQGKPAQPA
jgi:hypothetical protein